MRAIANVIGVGNTTVIKASEQSPRCFWALGRAFTDAGLPAGVLNIICCPRENAVSVTAAVIGHPAVKKVNFTGSVSVGREISTLCGQHMKPCVMEAGGKCSAIILPDADLDLAATECVKGAFLNVSHHLPFIPRYAAIVCSPREHLRFLTMVSTNNIRPEWSNLHVHRPDHHAPNNRSRIP